MGDSVLGTYGRIDEATFTNGGKAFLLVDPGNGNSFEVDMGSDFFFNEMDIQSRHEVQPVRTLAEVVRFCEAHGIPLGACGRDRLKDGLLLVGGEADMAVNEALEYFWKQED